LNNWIQALECRLEAITRLCDEQRKQCSSEQEAAKITAVEQRQLLTRLTNILRDEQHNERKAILILQVCIHSYEQAVKLLANVLSMDQFLQHWCKRGLCTQTLERFLLNNIEQVSAKYNSAILRLSETNTVCKVGYHLALILQLRGVEAHPFGGIKFSGMLYQAIALFCMKRLTPDASLGALESLTCYRKQLYLHLDPRGKRWYARGTATERNRCP
jgi:hypothetical protein